MPSKPTQGANRHLAGDPPQQCIQCEKALPENASFCPYCQKPVPGAKLPASLCFCPICGVQVLSDYKYCPSCSAAIPKTLLPLEERLDSEEQAALEADLYIAHQERGISLSYLDELVQQEITVGTTRRSEYVFGKMAAAERFDALFALSDEYNPGFVSYGFSRSYPPFVSSFQPHNANPLIKKLMLMSLIAQAMDNGYLLPIVADPSPIVLGAYAPIVLAYYQHTKHLTDEEVAQIRFRCNFGSLDCLLHGLNPYAYASLPVECFHTLRTVQRSYLALRDGALHAMKHLHEQPITLTCGGCESRGLSSIIGWGGCSHCQGTGKLCMITTPPAYRKIGQSVTVVTARFCPHCHTPAAPHQQFCLSCGGTIGTQQLQTPWQPSRVVEGNIVQASSPVLPPARQTPEHIPYWPCPCPQRANLCREDATWCVQCGKTFPCKG